MLYNDRSVLENYHLSASFALMQKDEHNILANLTKEEYRCASRFWDYAHDLNKGIDFISGNFDPW